MFYCKFELYKAFNNKFACGSKPRIACLLFTIATTIKVAKHSLTLQCNITKYCIPQFTRSYDVILKQQNVFCPAEKEMIN